MVIELKSGKTCISAPARPSATDGRVSGLVSLNQLEHFDSFSSMTESQPGSELAKH